MFLPRTDMASIHWYVCGQLYCDVDAARELAQSAGWQEPRTSPSDSTAVLCEPVEGWLFDDGVRLVPENKGEWMAMHGLFCASLNQHRCRTLSSRRP